MTPGKVDWFDDPEWGTVLQNAGLAGQIAKQGGCKGFMFDVEQYEGKLFDYRQQKQRDTKTFAEYQQKLRQRGQEWMRVVNKEYPDITILLTFGYSIAQPRGQAKDRSQVSYGLLADFLDGMLDGCSEKTLLVDAWESSYRYKEQRQFEQAYETIPKKGLDWTAKPEKYRKQVKAGFGLWMDCDWRRKGWGLGHHRFLEEPFQPGGFRGSGSVGPSSQRWLCLDLHRAASVVDQGETPASVCRGVGQGSEGSKVTQMAFKTISINRAPVLKLA